MRASHGVDVFNTSLHKQTLAQQVAESIKRSVLDGGLAAGDTLPTEPELAQQFGVSRAVIRDAVRLLSALGLVDVRHGRGMYITEPSADALAEALFIALRRSGASVWDVEELQQVLLPRIVAFAAERATESDVKELAEAADHCVDVFEKVLTERARDGRELGEADHARIADAYGRFYELLYAASHNTVISLLARPLYRLHSLKSWDSADEETGVTESVSHERAVFDEVIAAIRSRDPEAASEKIASVLAIFPESAKSAMRRTPIGDTAILPEAVRRPGSADQRATD
jgi:DNA-binding FadR family transcriptional regulator